MATQTTTLNGVDIERLRETIHNLKGNPELAKVQHRATNEWVDGAHCRTTVSDYYGAGEEREHAQRFELHADEPDVLLGEDHGPSATEALLYALSSCLNTTFVYHAAARGVQIDELRLDLTADLDLRGFLGLSDEVRNGYSNIQVTFHVKSPAPRETIEELVELAQKRSPVFDMVTHETPVSPHFSPVQGMGWF